MIIQGNTLGNSARRLSQEYGITMNDLAEPALFLQKDYIDNLTLNTCLESIDAVLTKREVHNATIIGVQLDILAGKNRLLSPLQEILTGDEGLHDVDEIMTLSIVNVYGFIGFMDYGYIDKVKPGILKGLNAHDDEHIHTFLDDTVDVIAAVVVNRLARSQPDLSDIIE